MAPLTLLLPHVGLIRTTVLSVFIGVILTSAFSAILVYAQELIPGKVGMLAGLFFGFAFGMGALGSAALGKLADLTSIKLNAARGGGCIFQSDHSVPSNVSAERYDFVVKLVRERGRDRLDLGEFNEPDVGSARS